MERQEATDSVVAAAAAYRAAVEAGDSEGEEACWADLCDALDELERAGA